MFLQIMPTEPIEEVTASSTLFVSVILAIFVFAAITFFILSKRVKK